MTPLRVLIVDDEAPARRKLRHYLEVDPETQVVGEAGDGASAVREILTHRPDVVLLDIQMPAMNGFQVVEALGEDFVPHVIFVTAFDEHAVRAFEVRAVDYLLKPVDRERLAEALSRVRDARRAPTAEGHDGSGEEAVPFDRFLVRTRSRLHFVPVEDVDWIGAAGNYVELHVGPTTHLLRGTLSELETRLPGRRFARVHRSTIVNLDRIHELQPWSHGDLLIVLKDGTELKLSRRYRDRLEGVFGG